MSVAFDHRDGGTDEASWAAAAPWSDAPELSLDFDRVVVASAHPDDETLGASGLIAMAGAAGIPVSLIVMTDGEGSHPHDTRIAARRRCESINAANQLGPAIPIRFVGLPDGGLRERRAAVRSALIGALSESPALRTLLVVPWWGDGHRDHRIVGEVGRQLAASGVHVVGYPIWMWHWAQADSVDTTSWRTLPLDEHARARKRAAIDEHRSQIEPAGAEPPILHDGMRRHFERHVEIFIDAGPLTDSPSQYDTEWFEAFYARHDDPWGLESRWYEQRKRDLLLAALPKRRYSRTLELGCATGMLTSGLADRSDRVVAVDVVDTAIRAARARVSGDAAEIMKMRLPGDWPDGRFDLIVLSELAYYWSPDEVALALDRVRDSLTDDGVLVACHWREHIDGCALDGNDVHAAIHASGLFRQVSSHREELFLLEVFETAKRSAL